MPQYRVLDLNRSGVQADQRLATSNADTSTNDILRTGLSCAQVDMEISHVPANEGLRAAVHGGTMFETGSQLNLPIDDWLTVNR